MDAQQGKPRTLSEGENRQVGKAAAEEEQVHQMDSTEELTREGTIIGRKAHLRQVDGLTDGQTDTHLSTLTLASVPQKNRQKQPQGGPVTTHDPMGPHQAPHSQGEGLLA